MSLERKLAAALGFLALGVAGACAQASSRDPFLPKCGQSTPTLSPIPFWGQDDLQRIPDLIAAPRSDSRKIVYIIYGADDVTVDEADVAYSVSVDVAAKTKKAGRLKVTFWGKPQPANGYYFFSGFYALERKPAAEAEVIFRRLDTFNIVSSRRFCIADAAVMPRAAPRSPPQSTAAPSLPQCGTEHERRIQIPTWKPQLTAKGYFRHLPPMGDGRIVYVSIDKPEKCPGDPDYLFTVSRPDNVNDVLGAGGLEVNLRGNFSPHRGGCRLQGFYINQPVFGMHNGWTESYFAPVDRGRVEATGQYCLSSRVVR